MSEQVNLKNFKVITDKLNNYFKDNKFMISSSVPTSGTYKVGDIVVNSGSNSAEVPMWICIEAGTPGTWEVFNSGGMNETELQNYITNIVQTQAISAVDYTDGTDIQIDGGSIGNLNELHTSNKESVVGAINELFQNVDSGKQIIADAIDDNNINKNSSFTAMGNAINKIQDGIEVNKNILLELLMNSGVTDLTGNESLDVLIGLLETLSIDSSKIVQVGVGYQSLYVLKNDGTLWVCGLNDVGQLGLGDTASRNVLTQVTTNIDNDVKQIIASCSSNSNVFIIKKDGSLWGCGRNGYGELGLGDTTKRTVFTKVTTNINNDVKHMSCGFSSTYIVKNDGTLWATGLNNYGQLGLSNTTNKSTFTQVTTNISDIKQVLGGASWAYIVKNDGSLWSCGLNDSGQLGLNNTTNKSVFTQVTTNVSNDVNQIVGASNSVYIIKNDGTLWACGYDPNNQLGLGSTGNKTKFTQVTNNINKDIKMMSVGYYTGNYTYAMIIKNDGTIWATGINNYGQYGNGNTTNNTGSFKQVTGIPEGEIDVLCCGYAASYILIDGMLYSCGMNDSGQLGLGSADSGANHKVFEPVDETNALRTQVQNLKTELSVNKSLLTEVLVDEEVELTGEETMRDLITKVDEEFENKSNSGGLDIISATELPVTGKENQICVITETPFDNYLMSTYYPDLTGVSSDSSTIAIYQGYMPPTNINEGSLLSITNKGFTTNYYIKTMFQAGNALNSYVFNNNVWNQLTNATVQLLIEGANVNSGLFGAGSVSNSTAYKFVYSSGVGVILQHCYSLTANYNYYGTFNKKVDLTEFNYCTITISQMDFTSSHKLYAICHSSAVAGYYCATQSHGTKITPIHTAPVTITGVGSYTFDISSWNTAGYFGFMLESSNKTSKSNVMTITNISFSKSM